MQSLTLTLFPTSISPPSLDLYPLRQISDSVLSLPTAGCNHHGMASRRESTSFTSLHARHDDDGYCTLVDFAGNGGGGREGTNVGDDLVVLLYHLDRLYESLYKFHISIQNRLRFSMSYITQTTNVLVRAPTGSGKIISAELAMLRLFSTQPDMKVIVSRMRYISSQTERSVRFVGLSTALANARFRDIY